jgi:hypothetical protein
VVIGFDSMKKSDTMNALVSFLAVSYVYVSSRSCSYAVVPFLRSSSSLVTNPSKSG